MNSDGECSGRSLEEWNEESREAGRDRTIVEKSETLRATGRILDGTITELTLHLQPTIQGYNHD